MLKEVVDFMDSFENGGSSHIIEIEEIILKFPKIFVINCKNQNKEEWKYENYTLLLNDKMNAKKVNNAKLKNFSKSSKMRSWLENHHDLLKYFSFDKYISPMKDINKALGSRSGFLSFSPYHIKLKKEWFSRNKKTQPFEKKIKKFKFKDKPSPWRKIYERFFRDLSSSYNENSFNEFCNFINGAYVIVKLNNFDEYDIFQKEYLDKKIFLKDDKNFKREGICPICNKKDVVLGIPPVFNTVNETKKPFNLHQTRPVPMSALVCSDCCQKLNQFDAFLTEFKIYLFPLFLDQDYQIEEIKYLKEKPGEKRNFFEIIEHLLETIHNTGSKNFNFLLLVQNKAKKKKDEIFFLDYVSNYKYEIGDFDYYFQTRESEKLNKKGCLMKVNRLLPFSKYFFGKIEKADNLSEKDKQLLYRLRGKIFNLTYRNHNDLIYEDIDDLVKWKIEDYTLNVKKNKRIIYEALELYLNSNLFAKGDNPMTTKENSTTLLEKIREKKDTIKNAESAGDIIFESDEEFAYWLGQSTNFLIQQSEASPEKLPGLLSPLLNCKTPDSLERSFRKNYLEKFLYKIRNFKDFRHLLIARVMDYFEELNTSFEKVKTPFFIGYYDSNIFFSSDKKSNSGD